jgi:hypothetical protein
MLMFKIFCLLGRRRFATWIFGGMESTNIRSTMDKAILMHKKSLYAFADIWDEEMQEFSPWHIATQRYNLPSTVNTTNLLYKTRTLGATCMILGRFECSVGHTKSHDISVVHVNSNNCVNKVPQMASWTYHNHTQSYILQYSTLSWERQKERKKEKHVTLILVLVGGGWPLVCVGL